MAQSLTMLEYTFLFDAADTPYTNRFQFEKDLIDCFTDKGLEAQPIKAVDGGQGRMIIYLRKKEEVTPPANADTTAKVYTPGSQLKNMSKNRGYDGKFK